MIGTSSYFGSDSGMEKVGVRSTVEVAVEVAVVAVEVTVMLTVVAVEVAVEVPEELVGLMRDCSGDVEVTADR
jgi:hypothetical protein